MPPRHRAGPPDDEVRFSGPALARLRAAATDAAWLVDRGYPLARVLELTGNRHDLDARQRHALRRCLCTAEQAQARQATRLCEVRGQLLHIDGLNLLVTLEVALAGGVILVGRDGALRDLAGVSGSYDFVPETPLALACLDRALARLQPAGAHWLIDASVGRSGQLARVLRARPWPCPCTVDVVPSPDADLAERSCVVSADSVVLQRCRSSFDLARFALQGEAVRLVAPCPRSREGV